MADEADRGQEREELYRELALTAHRLGLTAGTRPAAEQDGLCVDCGETIGAYRLEVQPLTMRCIECQQDFERQEGPRDAR